MVHMSGLIDRLNEAHLKILSEKFGEYSGPKKVLSLEGLVMIFPALKEASSELAKSIFAYFDINGSNRLEFREFCAGLSQLVYSSRKERAEAIFRMFDLNKNQQLDEDEAALFIDFCGDGIRAASKEKFNGSVKRVLTGLKLEAFTAWLIEHYDTEYFVHKFDLLPTPQHERTVVTDLMRTSRDMRTGQKVYLVFTGWWEAWKSYVMYDDHHRGIPSDAPFRSGSVVLNDRPINIDNTDLLLKNSLTELKPNLRQTIDYEVLSEPVWTALFKWYGGGPVIARAIIEEDGVKTIELYPPELLLFKCGPDLSPDPNSLMLMTFSAKTTLNEVATYCKKLFEMEYEVRLWLHNYQHSQWERLNANSSIKEAGLQRRSEIMAETQVFVEGEYKWQSKLKSNVPMKKTYQPGEQVELYKGNFTWVKAQVMSAKGSLVELKLLDGEPEQVNSAQLRPAAKQVLASPMKTVRVNPGAVGLQNLGNTCYMNSVVHSLSNTPLLREFLTSQSVEQYISTTNKAGFNGRVVTAISELVTSLWTTKEPKLRPSSFHKTIASIFSQFDNTDQHDCHEFLSILLDSMHEDLIRQAEVSPKDNSADNPTSDPESISFARTASIVNPTREQEIEVANRQWKSIQSFAGSVISDLCGGQTRCTILCSSCGNKKVLFEMFMSLSLPIPVSMETGVIVVVVPSTAKIFRTGYRVSQSLSIGALCELIAREMQTSPSRVMLVEAFDFNIVKLVTTKDWHLSAKSLAQKTSSMLYAFDVHPTPDEAGADGRPPQTKTSNSVNIGDHIDIQDAFQTWGVGKVVKMRPEAEPSELYVVMENDPKEQGEWISLKSQRLAVYGTHTIKVLNLHLQNILKTYNSASPVGIPMIISIGSWYTTHDLHLKVFASIKRFLPRGFEHLADEPDITNLKRPPYYISVMESVRKSCGICKDRQCEGCELPMDDSPLSSIFKATKLSLHVNWKPKPFINAEDVVDITEIEALRDAEEQTLDLSQCFEHYTKQEKVEVVCERCNSADHITMQVHIWRVPDILIVTMKRFALVGNQLEKITSLVDFPMFALDISEWVKSSEGNTGMTLSSNALNSAYDLYAVVNHLGAMTSGHYSAYCSNSDDSRHNRWLSYDDDHVMEVTGDVPKMIVSRNAYLLFYKRRKFASSNLVNLTF
jgi:ubiquitin C-terminal hydrolase